MKRIYHIILLTIITLAAPVLLSSCEGEEVQSDEVVLNAFGPSPLMRGAKLRFIGQNLDKVSAVVVPPSIELTAIEVVGANEINVTIPEEAEPGKVELRTPSGTITTKTMLTFIEPITVTKMTPNPVKPGTKLTLEGTYLELVGKIAFGEGVVVEAKEFASQSRRKIELTLPMEAVTAKPLLTDNNPTNPNVIELQDELQVVLPTVSEVAELSGKKPNDKVVLTGTDFDLITALVYGEETPIEEFSVEGDKLTFSLPAELPSGATISVVTASGIHVPVATIAMATPSKLAANPAKGLRPGDLITITGENLDVVKEVTFDGVEGAVVGTYADGAYQVELPEKAITGQMTLHTASSNSADIAIETQKPEVTSYKPSTVGAGSELQMQGTDLDLVAKVIFATEVEVEVTDATFNQITLKVPVKAESGEVTLVMKNGESVAAPAVTITKPEVAYLLDMPAEEYKAGTIYTGLVGNPEKLIGVKMAGEAVQYILHEEDLQVLIPETLMGEVVLQLVSSNGTIEYTMQVAPSGAVETVIMDEERNLGSWAGEDKGGAFRLRKPSFEGVKPGSTLKFYITVTGYGQLQINNANWAQIGNIHEFTDETQTEFSYELTQEVLDNILGTDDGWSNTAMVCQGQNLIVHKVTIVTF